jgi:alginate O-acetyltransferase complex protein AlgI
MVFSSFVFLFYFLPITIVSYFALKNRTWRNIILMLMSLFFYSWGEPLYILLIIASIIINWILALAIYYQKKFRTVFFVSGILVNLAGIGFFKYGSFFILNLGELTGITLPVPELTLPIGISFYTFQAISYLVDVHRGNIAPQKNPFYFGTYLSMFPQLIAGPIVRYATIEKELTLRNENANDFADGMRRFIIGFSKKVFIANTMGTVADTILVAEPSIIGAIPAWYAFIAYAFQIYFDFSGYSDMAIGLGRMFGFHFLENFNYPYISRSVTEFWRRWHISLSTFFRDYLYIPLGGNRVRPIRWVLNILVVWALTGLWHGASWNFVCWGLYYGIILIGEKKIWAVWLNQLARPLQHFYTIFLFIVGWVIFRVENIEDIVPWILTLFGFNGIGQITTLNVMNVLQYAPWFIIAAIASTPVLRNLSTRYNTATVGGWSYDLCTLLLFLTALTKLATGAFNPFIYFRF